VTEKSPPRLDPRVPQAALAGIALAGAIAVIMTSGAWTWWSTIVGLTILIVLHAYDIRPEPAHKVRSGLAFGAVWGLGAITFLGILYQEFSGPQELWAVAIWTISVLGWTVARGRRRSPSTGSELARRTPT
jgi:hypothetical protein